ncbi:hypothetical protein J1614_003833 [Plenodomus biglobosus]|nr:hypothetical protein J1614_003833 [Plenodomus biglobosus]
MAGYESMHGVVLDGHVGPTNTNYVTPWYPPLSIGKCDATVSERIAAQGPIAISTAFAPAEEGLFLARDEAGPLQGQHAPQSIILLQPSPAVRRIDPQTPPTCSAYHSARSRYRRSTASPHTVTMDRILGMLAVQIHGHDVDFSS